MSSFSALVLDIAVGGNLWRGERRQVAQEIAVSSDVKKVAQGVIEQAREELLSLSHAIHGFSETAFEEVRSSACVGASLEQAGFAVEMGYGGIPTAIRASTGCGPLRVVICAEYDALPGIGHACGHNVIAAAAVGAGLGLAEVADEVGLEVTILGTPAEEAGGGKVLLLEAGAFDSAHLAMMVHPAPFDVAAPPVVAIEWLEVSYKGKEAHASAFPEQGINAADALVVAQVAIGLLRQHLNSTDRVHGIVTEAGTAANIIPALGEASFMVRTPHIDQLDALRRRVEACFEAGALATGAELTLTRPNQPYSHLEHHARLAARYRRNAERLGRSFYEGNVPPVSTDMGNVSLHLPTIHPFIGIDSLPAGNHQPGFTDAAARPPADQAAIDGAVALAWTAIDAAMDPDLTEELMAAARKRHP